MSRLLSVLLVAVCIVLGLLWWLSGAELSSAAGLVTDEVPAIQANHSTNTTPQSEVSRRASAKKPICCSEPLVDPVSLAKRLNGETKQAYKALKSTTLAALAGEFERSVYSGLPLIRLTVAQTAKPGMLTQSLVWQVSLSRDDYETYAERPPTPQELFPARGVLFGSALDDDSSDSPLLDFVGAEWRKGYRVETPHGLVESLNCGPGAKRSWRGKGRLSHSAYVEPFVLCEGNEKFSIAVGWRTSDVCLQNAMFSLATPIEEVRVVKVVGSGQERLSIASVDGHRVLLGCRKAQWQTSSVGRLEWPPAQAVGVSG